MPNHTFWAEMSCGGCSGAITRLISKMPGVTDVKCSVEENKVEVVTSDDSLGVDDFMNKISRWATNANKKVSKTPLA